MPDSDQPSTPFDPRQVEVDALGPTAGMAHPVELVAAEVPPVRHRTRRTAIIATVAVVVVLAASGTAAARLWFASTGSLPEQAVPASTAAFVRINLTPGYAQRVKVLGLLGKFPTGAGGSTAKGDPLDSYRSSLLTELKLGVSAQDVKGWFGDRAGVGVWVDGHGRPVQIAVLASSDDGAANKALRAARDRAGSDHLGFVVSGGYALLTKADKGAQTAADEASQAAKKADLADNPHFRTALAALPGDEALVAYADLGQADKLATAATTAAYADGTSGKDKLTGYVVSGAQAVDDGIEIRSRLTGAKQATGGIQDALAALGATPGGSPALAAVTGPLGDTTTGLSRLAGVDGLSPWSVLSPDLGSATDDAAPALSDTLNVEPSVGPDGKLHFVGPDGKTYVIDPNDPSTFPTDGATDPGGPDGPDGPDGASGVDIAAGNAASKSVAAAFGKATSIRLIVTGAPGKGQYLPVGELTVQLPDDASAKTFAKDLGTLTGAGMVAPPGALTTEQHGTSVQARTAGYTPGSGKLADEALFKEATAGGPATPTTAVYIDIHKLATAGGAPADTLKQWGPVKAIGMTAGRSGDDSVSVIRIVIK